jgi:hypothetical protein
LMAGCGVERSTMPMAPCEAFCFGASLCTHRVRATRFVSVT